MGRIYLAFLLTIGIQYFVSAQMWVIPNQVDDKVQTGTNHEELLILQYPYFGDLIDLRDFKKVINRTDIPDEIKIIAPSLTGFNDTSVLVTFIKEGPADEGQLVIWLAGNYFSNEVVFFIDRNLDYDFTNDRKPLVQKSTSPSRKINLFPIDAQKPVRTLTISVPKRELPAKYKPKKHNAKIINQIAWGITAGMGLASINYSYDNTELMFPTWYDVPITEKNVNLELTYNTSRFLFGLRGTYQSLFYWTSYLNVRFEEKRIIRNPLTGARRVYEGVDVKRNLDQHAKNRFQLAALAGYRLRLGKRKSIELQPILTVGKTFFADKTYYPNKFDQTVGYEQEPALFVDGSLRIEFPVGHYRTFGLGYGYSKLWWEPTGFFADLPAENAETKYQAHNINISYRMGF